MCFCVAQVCASRVWVRPGAGMPWLPMHFLHGPALASYARQLPMTGCLSVRTCAMNQPLLSPSPFLSCLQSLPVPPPLQFLGFLEVLRREGPRERSFLQVRSNNIMSPELALPHSQQPCTHLRVRRPLVSGHCRCSGGGRYGCRLAACTGISHTTLLCFHSLMCRPATRMALRRCPLW